MNDSDENLLNSFAIHRDESALRALADRYLGLIFHSALRRTRNRQLAEEVSQNILCALANKASTLAKTPDLLPAWLHRATVYESSKAMRAEASHQRRKQLAHTTESSSEMPTWAEAIPHLDAAIDQLPDSDRRVLLLHYFENRSFPLIARSLGKSTAAIQKQSQRALEKLARLLRTKGVALSAAVIATGLTAEFAKAAPVSLIQAATAAALGGSASYSTTGLTLMFASKSKVLVPLVILLIATPLILQQIAVSQAQSRIHDLTILANRTDQRRSTNRSTASLAAGRRLSNNFDIMVLLEECDRARPTDDSSPLEWFRFRQKLGKLDAGSLERLIRECIALPVHKERKAGLLRDLVAALSFTDAGHAVRFAFEASPQGNRKDEWFLNNLQGPFTVWAKEDLSSALAWYRRNDMWPGFNAKLINALVQRGSPELREFLERVPEAKRGRMVEEGIMNGSRDIYFRDGNDNEPVETLAPYVPVIRELVPEAQREHALQELADEIEISRGDGLTSLRRFFRNTEMLPEEAAFIAGYIMVQVDGYPDPDGTWKATKSELTKWLDSGFPGRAEEIIKREKTRRASEKIRP